MTTRELACWKCGHTLEDVLLPLPRLAKCRSCNADLHCCRQCRFFDLTVSKQCREPIAEPVQDKQRANFCGYLEIDPTAYKQSGENLTAKSQDSLSALFGLKPEEQSGSDSTAEAARRKLDDLFRKE